LISPLKSNGANKTRTADRRFPEGFSGGTGVFACDNRNRAIHDAPQSAALDRLHGEAKMKE
jgi:hypothetical protein